MSVLLTGPGPIHEDAVVLTPAVEEAIALVLGARLDVLAKAVALIKNSSGAVAATGEVAVAKRGTPRRFGPKPSRRSQALSTGASSSSQGEHDGALPRKRRRNGTGGIERDKRGRYRGHFLDGSRRVRLPWRKTRTYAESELRDALKHHRKAAK